MPIQNRAGERERGSERERARERVREPHTTNMIATDDKILKRRQAAPANWRENVLKVDTIDYAMAMEPTRRAKSCRRRPENGNGAAHTPDT